MADVDAALKDWSPTSSNNKPTGATTIGTGLDDNLRELQGAIIRGLSYKGADIASATTADLGAIEGLMHDITGTTTITSFGTVRQGLLKVIKFEGALTLTHNATSLIIPGGADITTADGDIAIFISEGSGNWRCVSYFKAGSMYATLTGTETLTNKTLVAPALGTPTSGVVTNLTGTASININGTVGATTPNTGAFTTLTASGDVAVATNKFTVAAASGNTAVAGTLGVTGVALFTEKVGIGGASSSSDQSSWLDFASWGALGILGGNSVTSYVGNAYPSGGVWKSKNGALGSTKIDNDPGAGQIRMSFAPVVAANATATFTDVVTISSTGLAVTGTGSYTGILSLGTTGAAGTLTYNRASDGAAAVSTTLSGNDWSANNGAGGGYLWKLGGTTSLTLDSSGNLLVGGGTSFQGVTAQAIVSGVDGGGVSTTKTQLTPDKINYNGSAGTFYVLDYAGTGVKLTTGSTSWAAQSDIRFKDVIEPIAAALDKVSALRAVIGKYKTDKTGIRRSFLIAQDLAATFPEAVDFSDQENLGVRYTEVVPLLVAAIKELSAKNDALEARLSTLEAA